jgi:SAM-dependent methyltransferase
MCSFIQLKKKESVMSIRRTILSALSEPIKKRLRLVRAIVIARTPLGHLVSKYDDELAFWRDRFKSEAGTFTHSHFERIMLGMAGERTGEFLRGKIVADFGCGPRGSLVWAQSAQLRIGIDVLADRYADNFSQDIISHNMIYLKSTERVIPLPSGFVDIVFTLNALDHADDIGRMCNELLRILKPGGIFLGSFNLEEPASPTEPQRLTEEILEDRLLRHLDVESYRLSAQNRDGETYAALLNGTESQTNYVRGEEGHLWVKARRRTLP